MDTTNQTMLRILATDIQALHRGLKKGATLYALVEAGSCSAPDALVSWTMRHRLPSNSLFAGTAESRYAAEGPWLIALPETCSRALLEELAAFAALHRALLLIGSPLPLLRLTLHLQSWLNAVTQDAQGGSTELLVRYFDACIGMAMVDLWPEAERQAFVGAFDWWGGWDERFAPHIRPGRRDPVAAIRTTPLHITEAMLEQIDTLNRAERLLALVAEQDVDAGELDGIPPWLRGVIAHQAVAQANALGLGGWQDARLAVALALRVNPEILARPVLRTPISHAKEAGSFANAIAGLPPNVLAKEHAEHAAAALQRVVDRVVTEMTARTGAAA